MLTLMLFGLLVGILSGLLGIGGGIVLVPGLVLLFGFSQQEAQGTSLAVLIPPIGIFAALVYYQHGYVRLPVVGWLVLGFVVGSYVGAKLLPYVPMVALRLAFGAILLYMGLVFVLAPKPTPLAAALPAGLGTLGTFLLALLIRRSLQTRDPKPPPTDQLEYHI